MSWEVFDQLKHRLTAGDAAAVVEPLRELRCQWSEPALAPVLADALAQLGRTEEGIAGLQLDVESGIANHWTHYSLSQHLAALGRLRDASLALRQSHTVQGWSSSARCGYIFTQDDFTVHLAQWQKWFATLIPQKPLQILQIGCWQGACTLWLLDEVISTRGGEITWVGPWQDAREPSLLAPLGLTLERLAQQNLVRSGRADHVCRLAGDPVEQLSGLTEGVFDCIVLQVNVSEQLWIQQAIQAYRLLAPRGYLVLAGRPENLQSTEVSRREAIDFYLSIFANDYIICHEGMQYLLQRQVERKKSKLQSQSHIIKPQKLATICAENPVLLQSSAYPVLCDQINTSILDFFSSVGNQLSPVNYAVVNYLRELQHMPAIKEWLTGLEATVKIDKTTPLILINNFASARKQLVSQKFWIAYGNVRTGSTMVFNLLRILANSLSSSVISAWEGDLASPDKFFDLVNESPGINLGVLKIHRCHEAVNAKLELGEAKAILSHRDMKMACFSYWRMLNNSRSPFFQREPNLEHLDNFLSFEINNFLLKSKQKNTLIVRESDLRWLTAEVISRIANFIDVTIADKSLLFLSEFLSSNNLRQLAEENQQATNSTGHEQITYLHPGHISESSSEAECSPEARDYIMKLIEKNQSFLDNDGYCSLAKYSE